MDWFTWLSKTDLNPALVYQYALTFSHNELGQDDIPFFTHDFLQSMGVKVAKHRLEILKLARKERGGMNVRFVLWLVLAIKQTKNYLVKHVRTLIHRDSSSLSVVPPTRNHSLRWKVAMLQRNKKLKTASPGDWPMMTRCESPGSVLGNGGKTTTLMLTEGSGDVIGESRNSESTQSLSWVETEGNGYPGFVVTKDGFVNLPWNGSFSSSVIHSVDGGEYWSSSTEEIKWDTMFHNLKPT